MAAGDRWQTLYSSVVQSHEWLKIIQIFMVRRVDPKYCGIIYVSEMSKPQAHGSTWYWVKKHMTDRYIS